MDRKSRIRDYKDNPPAGGVFLVRNIATDRVLIGHAANLAGMLNRQRFQLEMGSHPDHELQADWNSLGANSFEFQVLDELEPNPDLAPEGISEELIVLHRLWLENLADSDFYPQSRRGI